MGDKHIEKGCWVMPADGHHLLDLTDEEVAAAVRLVYPIVAAQSDDGREWVRVYTEKGQEVKGG